MRKEKSFAKIIRIYPNREGHTANCLSFRAFGLLQELQMLFHDAKDFI